MSSVELNKMSFKAGIWEGELSGYKKTSPPTVLVYQHGDVIGKCEVQSLAAGNWSLRYKVLSELISDGAMSFLFVLEDTGETLASLPMLAGEALAHDFYSELTLLRDELDLLKRAFRQHCSDTK